VSTCITYAGTPSLQPPDLRGNDPVARRDDPGAMPGPGRKPHVCFVAPTAWPVIAGARDVPVVGGAEVQQGFIARALVSRGYRVSMISLDYGQEDLSEVDGIRMYKAHRPDEGIPILRFVHPRMTKMWRAMKRVGADIYYQRTSSVTTALTAAFCRHHGKLQGGVRDHAEAFANRGFRPAQNLFPICHSKIFSPAPRPRASPRPRSSSPPRLRRSSLQPRSRCPGSPRHQSRHGHPRRDERHRTARHPARCDSGPQPGSHDPRSIAC